MSANTPKTKAAFIASLLGSISATPDDIAKAATIMGDDQLAKAVSQQLRPGEEIASLWDEGEFHKAPTKEQIKTGPAQHASGSGAEKMIAEYSNPAPQDGTVMTPMRVAEELGQMRGYMKSQGDMINSLGKSVNGLTTAMTSYLASVAQPDSVGDHEVKAFSARYAAKAEQALRGARKLISKAGRLAEEIDDLEGDARKTAKAQVKDLRGSAATLLCKARDFSLAARFGETDPAAEVRKSVDDVLDANPVLKADVSAFHEKEGEEDHEKGAERKMKKMAKKAAKKAASKAAKKAAKAAAKTGDGAAAKAADGEAAKAEALAKNANCDEDGNQKQQADGAAKAETIAQLQKAVDGIGMLQMNVSQLMETVTGRPLTQNATTPLTLIKGGADAEQRIDKIAAKIDGGDYDTPVVMKASDLLSKLTAVREGKLSRDVWLSYLRAAPVEVQNIFADAA